MFKMPAITLESIQPSYESQKSIQQAYSDIHDQAQRILSVALPETIRILTDILPVNISCLLNIICRVKLHSRTCPLVVLVQHRDHLKMVLSTRQ